MAESKNWFSQTVAGAFPKQPSDSENRVLYPINHHLEAKGGATASLY
jgi:hypothetical protein